MPDHSGDSDLWPRMNPQFLKKSPQTMLTWSLETRHSGKRRNPRTKPTETIAEAKDPGLESGVTENTDTQSKFSILNSQRP
jgi:hypothetical protein